MLFTNFWLCDFFHRERKLRLGLNETSHVSVVLLPKHDLNQIWQNVTTYSAGMFVMHFYLAFNTGLHDVNKEWAAKKGHCQRRPILWVLWGLPGNELCWNKRFVEGRQTQNGISCLFNGLQCYKYFIEQHSGRKHSECIIKIKWEILCSKILHRINQLWPHKSNTSSQQWWWAVCCRAESASSQMKMHLYPLVCLQVNHFILLTLRVYNLQALLNFI